MTESSEAARMECKRAALAVTGAEGLPPILSGGNVQRPYTSLKLSLRIPPLVDGHAAYTAMKELLEKNPPNNATVSFEGDGRLRH